MFQILGRYCSGSSHSNQIPRVSVGFPSLSKTLEIRNDDGAVGRFITSALFRMRHRVSVPPATTYEASDHSWVMYEMFRISTASVIRRGTKTRTATPYY